jgi:phenylalanyl-tRNA synthetase beta chain
VKILLEHLRTHTDLPANAREARNLLDDVGIEVKTADATEWGTLFNVELLANRGDHYCYGGIAREVSGRTGKSLQYPPVRAIEAQPAPAARIRIETPLCLVYTLTELFAPEGPARALPDAVLAPMLAADMHSTLAPVDASNLTNLDLGQPTHAFDADTIEGPITIRTSRAGEKAWMLFTEAPVEIPAGTLVIADDAKILGIAGVIGCVESAVTEKTTRILLESACFDPVAIRIASRALNQATDAAARFMRGGDPTLPLVGAGRVALLLEKHCGYRVGDSWSAGDWKNPQREIAVDVARMRRFIGADLSAEAMAGRLTRYGFAVELAPERLVVTVPPHRIWDVFFEADLAEELLKSVGYNETAVTLPHVSMGSLPSHAENVTDRVNELLAAEGFYEIFTDSFYSRKTREQLGIGEGDALWPHVETQNAIERNYSLLRNNTVAQALDALATNVNLKSANVKMFEWARIYLADPSAENGVCREQAILWGLANGRDRGPFWGDKGRPADAIYLKGLLEQMRLELRVDLQPGPAAAHRLAALFHPGRSAGIVSNGRTVGIFGELHPALLQRFDIKRQRPVYFELDADALFAPPVGRVYTEPPARQPVVRNLAYAIPAGLTAAAVRDAMRSVAPPFLREIRMVDVYEIPNDPARARAVTYEIEYLSEEALTGETTNAATEEMMAAVAAAFGDKVTLRA